LRILVVEDDEYARSTLQRLLELDGHDVETAGDGLHGAETIEFQKPDVALVDIQLPVLDGYQVARRVRSSRENDGVYLVALTGFGRPEDERLAVEAGFDAHLTKPLDYDALERLLNTRSRFTAAPR
jgi:CheY-like chemotaxis protein